MPLVRLAKLVYTNNSADDENLRSWYNIVRICDLLAAVEIFGDATNIVSDKKSLTFVSAERVNQLHEAQHDSLNGLVAKEVKLVEHETSAAAGPKLVDELPTRAYGIELEKQVVANSKAVESRESAKPMIKKILKAKSKQALSSGKFRINSMKTIRCSTTKGRECEAEVTNISSETLDDLNAEVTRVQRVRRDDDNSNGSLGHTICLLSQSFASHSCGYMSI